MNFKPLTDYEECEATHHKNRPPIRNGSESLYKNFAKTLLNTNTEKDQIRSTDLYFKTSASSNEGLKSQYQSTGEAISLFSPKDSQTAERVETAGSIRLNLIENENQAVQTKKVCLLNNIKLLYDQNTDRSKKRTEQMKKMRSAKSSGISNFEENSENIYE